jgi:methylmalonyl-CoA mutase
LTNKQKLFDQFSPVTTKEWLDRIMADLKGADFNKKLVWKTNEGFDVMPFYRREDLEKLSHMENFLPLFLRGDVKTTNNSWLIRQNITVADYYAANRKARSILTKGVNSLGFIIADPESINEKNFETLLKDINPECIEINFQSNGKAREILALLAKISEKNRFNLSKIRGAIETDPLGKLMINGTLCVPVEAGFDYLASLTREAVTLPDYRILQINGSNFNNAGSDAVQELAFSISMAVEYLAQLTDRDLEAEYSASKLRFSFGTGSNYFMEIAKLRAARILWSAVGSGYKPENKDSFRMEIHCVTSEWNKTVYDPYVNMLRTQTEAMSAALGGTDSLTILPFDIALSQEGEFPERIARNQQLLLKEESYFDKVADPASGSYYIETLTALIVENSWKLFLEIEDKGGFLASLKSGYIQKRLADSAGKRKNDVALRKEILLGTNQYPNLNEKISPEIIPGIKFGSATNGNDLLVEPVKLFRGSEEYEKLRLAVDRALKRPVVFLLTIGNHVFRKARSQFSGKFFGCAGYRIIDNDGFETVDEGVQSALDSNADIVVICSSDEEYSVFAPDIFNRLKGKAIIVVAGNPESIDELKAKGLDNFISIRSNISETLKFYNSRLGITF